MFDGDKLISARQLIESAKADHDRPGADQSTKLCALAVMAAAEAAPSATIDADLIKLANGSYFRCAICGTERLWPCNFCSYCGSRLARIVEEELTEEEDES